MFLPEWGNNDLPSTLVHFKTDHTKTMFDYESIGATGLNTATHKTVETRFL